MKFKKIILIVMDSVGCGEMPDASEYGDSGSNTLGNLAKAVGGFDLPNLESLGLGKIVEIYSKNKVDIVGFYGKCYEVSKGKDTTTGHWEMMGLKIDKPFDTFPNGFPDDIKKDFEEAIGSKVLWYGPISGTEVIKILGEEHIKTKKPIVYTSADSVFQIACHEKYYGLDKLYEISEIARKVLNESKYNVGRVIARPFLGEPGSFYRTKNRKDYAVEPPQPTVLDMLKENNIEVVGIGKIPDIFFHRGFTVEMESHSNPDALAQTLEAFYKYYGFIFVNLVDFDMLWGHRNDVEGYYKGLKEFDNWLGEFLKLLNEEHLLIITADHGNDPTTPSTDHSREYVPLLCYTPKNKCGMELGVRYGFYDIGATILENFGLKPSRGISFLSSF
ncbi:MAG: phosphopentomutase [bacterium]|nr:phosphopentomutase [bacterium]